LLSKVDGVIIVGRVGRNRRDVAERLHETLSSAGAPLLGVIANGFKARRNASYAYAYDYAYTASGPGPDSAEPPSANGVVTADQPVPTSQT
jgi:Mrp family chromosome partitioning ATPase